MPQSHDEGTAVVIAWIRPPLAPVNSNRSGLIKAVAVAPAVSGPQEDDLWQQQTQGSRTSPLRPPRP